MESSLDLQWGAFHLPKFILLKLNWAGPVLKLSTEWDACIDRYFEASTYHQESRMYTS